MRIRLERKQRARNRLEAGQRTGRRFHLRQVVDVRMLAGAEPYINSTDKWYLVFFPGFFLLLTILAVNFLGDALRDALDPQSRF